MPLVRRAVAEDAEELVRLRKIMLDSMNPSSDTSWQSATTETLRAHLADAQGELAAFVVDAPTGDGRLAACAAGVIHRGLGSPGNPFGLSGHVSNVCTDPEYRHRGFSRACMEALLGWYRDRDVRRIDLHATMQGEPLYTSLGFVRTPAPSMRLTL
ncbi:GNAT family N-acetyltransferase [Streptomyces sp. YJ-C3]